MLHWISTYPEHLILNYVRCNIHVNIWWGKLGRRVWIKWMYAGERICSTAVGRRNIMQRTGRCQCWNNIDVCYGRLPEWHACVRNLVYIFWRVCLYYGWNIPKSIRVSKSIRRQLLSIVGHYRRKLYIWHIDGVSDSRFCGCNGHRHFYMVYCWNNISSGLWRISDNAVKLMPCKNCPCPDACLQWPMFCEWADHKDTDRYAHICARSSIGLVPESHLSFRQRIKTFRVAMERWARAGFRVASWREYRRRRAICLPCEFYQGGFCKACGCAGIAKPFLATEKCPKGKW